MRIDKRIAKNICFSIIRKIPVMAFWVDRLIKFLFFPPPPYGNGEEIFEKRLNFFVHHTTSMINERKTHGNSKFHKFVFKEFRF